MSRPELHRSEVAIVMPLLNEAEILPSLISDIGQRMDRLGCKWSMMFINDGSTDSSGVLLDELADCDCRIKVLHLSRNFGHSAAVRAGLDFVDADAIILMDSDGQDDPSAIPSMISYWQEGADVVYAVRFARKEAWWKRILFSGFYRVLQSVASVEIPRDAGNFGLLDRTVVDHVRRLPESDRYFPGLRSWVGFRQAAVPVERLARHDGKPRVRLRGLVSLAKTALFGFSRVPLQAFYLLAVVSALVSVSCIGFALFHKVFTGQAIPGWTSITSVSAFFGAINSLGIAILGEYVARIYDQVRGRPSYIVARSRNLARASSLDSTETIADAILADIHDLRSEVEVMRHYHASDMETSLWMTSPLP